MTDLIFFGSSSFSIPTLSTLLKSPEIKIISVITTPDKPAGRHLQLTPNPLKAFALEKNLPVSESFPDLVEPNTAGLVAAYGKIIPKSLIDKFGGRLFNIHPSILPLYRGASPLQSQILAGETRTAATIIQLDEQMDHGPVVSTYPDFILPTDNWITLGERLFAAGAEKFIAFLPSLKTNEITTLSQDHTKATFTKKLTRQDGFVPYEQISSLQNGQPVSQELDRKFRAFYSWPGVWSTSPEGKRIKLKSISPVQITESD